MLVDVDRLIVLRVVLVEGAAADETGGNTESDEHAEDSVLHGGLHGDLLCYECRHRGGTRGLHAGCRDATGRSRWRRGRAAGGPQRIYTGERGYAVEDFNASVELFYVYAVAQTVGC